jgi:capsular exopolysaccharide synthesis family protein
MTSLLSTNLHPNSAAAEEPLHLRDYWRVVLRRRLLVLSTFFLVVLAVGARTLFVKKLYQGTVQILIERQLPNVLDYGNSTMVNEMWEDFYQTQYRILQSRLLARKVIEKLNLLHDPEFLDPAAPVAAKPVAADGTSPAMEATIDTFLDRLRVEPVKNSQLLSVGFRSMSPARAAEVANTLAAVYIQQILEFHNKTSAETGQWLGTESNEQGQKVEAAERALQTFDEQQGLVNIEERRALLEQKLKDLGSALTAAKTRRLDKEALLRQMRAAPNVEDIPEVIASGFIQSLRSELASLERESTQLAAKGYLENHPDVVKVREQIEATRAKIALEAGRVVKGAENDLRVASEQEGNVAGALEAAKAESRDLAQRSLKYDTLKRDLDASKKLEDTMLGREKDANVARSAQVSNVRVVDAAAEPQQTVRPRPLRDTALSVVFGLMLGVGLAFFRDYLDVSVGKPSDVRRLGLPLLGIIPEQRARKGALIVTNGHRKEPFAEGYRVVRAALQGEHSDGAGQVILVTSTLPEEGKSLTAANLALTLASAQEQVLLVDADLRRPTQSELLGLKRAPGLCEILTGVASLESALQRVPGTRLRVLTSGSPLESSPADLLAATSLRALMVVLRSKYSWIVVDSAPAGTVADALSLAPFSESVVMVARCGKVTTDALGHALERLAQAKGHVAGIVLNRARPEREQYDYSPYFQREAFAGNGPRSHRGH